MSEIILNTSPEAAVYRTDIKGWVSASGIYYGNGESSARWDGCTHIACKECGEPTKKHRTVCGPCREKMADVKYSGYEIEAWDESQPIYADSVDEWFNEWSDATDYCEWNKCSIDSLRLLHTKPEYHKQIDAHDYYYVDGVEDQPDLPPEVYELVDELNKYMRGLGPVTYWMIKVAVEIPAEVMAEYSNTSLENSL